MNDDIILFVKFGEKKHIAQLLNGKMYFSNAEKFRGIEKETGLKGQGDAYEAVLRFGSGQAIWIDEVTGRMGYIPKVEANIQFEDTYKIPVFCITQIKASDCFVEEKNGKSFLKVNNAFVGTIKNHFPKADAAGVFFSPAQFLYSVSKLGVTMCDQVRYFDFAPKGDVRKMLEYISQNTGAINKRNEQIISSIEVMGDGDQKRTSVTKNNMKRILFCKDSYFSGEKEYRIILPNKRINTPQHYYVRWGKLKRKLYPIEEFFSGIEI